MTFLIEYDRRAGALIMLREFADSERREAADARLLLELELHRRGVEHEVVLLEAENKEALLKTHDRYFRTLREILESAVAELNKP